MAGNQYKTDPRQALFLKGYLDPKSSTFSNAYRSAISAGYEEEYAKAILSKDLDWMAENVNTEKMLKKAEKRLDEVLDLPLLDKDGKTDKVVADVAKFTTSRLGKKKWSEKSPFVDDEGKSVFNPISRKAVNDYLNESETRDTENS
jgi:hypothetical protein